MRAWGLPLFGDIVHGASNDAQLTWLFRRLDLAVYLTIAWAAGSATGRDFCAPWHRDRKDVRPRTASTRNTRLRSTSKADVTEPVNPLAWRR
jgi:hypothetical protein